MTRKIYAVKLADGKEVARKEIGTARFYAGNTISARKYNELKLKLFKAYNIKSGETVALVTADGLRDSFGGYPAVNYVRFERYMWGRCTND